MPGPSDATAAAPHGQVMPVACGVGAAVIGAIGLLGWWADVERLRVVVTGYEAMKPITAVSLVLLGVSLALGEHHRPAAQRFSLAGAAVAGALGALGIIEHALDRSSFLDTALFGDSVRAAATNQHPGRMALTTALCVAASGAGIVLRDRERSRVAHGCGQAVAFVASVALAGYVYGATSFHRVGAYSSMAVHTSVALALVGLGLVWATPQHGLLALARHGPVTNLLIRRALPAIIGVPAVVAWLVLRQQDAGWYDEELALALMVVTTATAGVLVLWLASRTVAHLDDERASALEAVTRSRDSLEAEVAARTATLADQTAIQQASLDALEQGVFLSTLSGEVLLINEAGAALLGYAPDELTEMYRTGRWQTFREDGSVLPPEERPLRKTMDSGEPTTGNIIVWRTKAGERRILRVSTRPVRDERGELIAVVTAAADVTRQRTAELEAEQHVRELRSLNADLEQAVTIKDRFLATATHDMRTPISAITGFAELLNRAGTDIPDAERASMLAAIERQGHRLAALVQDLLSIAVLDGGGVTVEPQLVQLPSALRQITDDAALDVPVTLDVPESATAVVDPLRLAQMVTNLLANAARYGRPPISLEARVDGQWVTVRVRDEGDGVPPELVGQLFERFSPARKAPMADRRGTGLGLAIVRGLAQLHGGEAWYEPNEPHGACFAIRLPSGGYTGPPASGSTGSADGT